MKQLQQPYAMPRIAIGEAVSHRTQVTRSMFAAVLAIVVVLSPNVAFAWQTAAVTAPELTDAERAAAESIQQSKVLGTVAFLSSDELAGRQTPSPELSIAARYVASRFLGAGLEPLDQQPNFFQTHEFAVSKPPAELPVIKHTDGAVVRALGVLSGPSEDLDLTCEVLTEADLEDRKTVDCVILDELAVPPQATTKPASVLITLYRRTRAAESRGAQLVLMKCDPQSPLLQVAGYLQQQPLPDRPSMRPGCAVVLIPNDLPLAGQQVSVTMAAQQVSVRPVRNVLGVLRGSDPELNDQAIFVTAHLDHIGKVIQIEAGDDTALRGELGASKDVIYNGADDNATGVTAVLSLADAFAKLPQRPRRSIVFATFWGEEKGLLGSKEFVRQPLWPLDKITANVNIEMVGRPESDAREKMWMTGWTHSNLGSLMNAGSQRVGVEVFDRTDIGEMLYTRSDNASFANVGVIAHSFSAGSLHGDYHQVTDEWQKLDIPHMTKVIQGLYAGVLHVANRDDGPQ